MNQIQQNDKSKMPDKIFFEKVLNSIFLERSVPILLDYKEKPVVSVGDSYTSNIKRIYLKCKFEEK